MVTSSIRALVLVICSSFILCEKNVPNIVPQEAHPTSQTPNLLSKPTQLIPNFCADYYGPICENCNTLLTCAGQVINVQGCASMDPTKPFCVDNACTATPIYGCPQSFRCTGIGQFPNPHDCNSYYYCTKPSDDGFLYKCPVNYVYDSKTGKCKELTEESDCNTISCSANYLNRYQVFEADKSILAYCLDVSSSRETLLFRCKDFENMEYDEDTLQCRFVCKAEGRYADRVDCNNYYECYRSGNSLQFERVRCPRGFSFDKVLGRCTKLPSGATCQSELS